MFESLQVYNGSTIYLNCCKTVTFMVSMEQLILFLQDTIVQILSSFVRISYARIVVIPLEVNKFDY